MARYGRLLTDAQWVKIRPCLPRPARHRRGGRPRADDRKVLEGILWILRSGARWQDLAEEFPSPSTCWRRLRDWEEQEVWLSIWRTFPGRVEPTPAVELERGLSGRQLCAGQKRGLAVGKIRRGKGTKWMVVVDGQGLALGNQLYAATLHEVGLAEVTLDAVQVPRRGRRQPAQR